MLFIFPFVFTSINRADPPGNLWFPADEGRGWRNASQPYGKAAAPGQTRWRHSEVLGQSVSCLRPGLWNWMVYRMSRSLMECLFAVDSGQGTFGLCGPETDIHPWCLRDHRRGWGGGWRGGVWRLRGPKYHPASTRWPSSHLFNTWRFWINIWMKERVGDYKNRKQNHSRPPSPYSRLRMFRS